MASIFISRAVDRDLWFSVIGNQHTLTDLSLIDFKSIPFKMPSADWIFFYSKNGVKYFFEQQPGQLIPYKWAAFGSQTAEYLSQYVLDIDFIGDGNPKSTSSQFQNVVQDHEKICFARAKRSKQSVQQYLDTASVVDLVVYDNTPMEQTFTENFDVLIFTSPLNVEAYSAENSFHNKTIIAIGETTANALEAHVNTDVLLAKKPSTTSLLEELQSVL